MSLEQVLRRREAERHARINSARRFVDTLGDRLNVQAAVLFGSVARGDFNRWSDIDVLILADDLPRGWLERCDLLGTRPPGVQPIAWTRAEWRHQHARGNPIVVEALDRGIWLKGGPPFLES